MLEVKSGAKQIKFARIFVRVNSRLAYALAVCVGTALGLVAIPHVDPLIPTSPVLRGLKIGGEPIGEGVDPQTWLSARARAVAERQVILQHGELRHQTTLGQLGITIDVPNTVWRAKALGHEGSLVRRLRETAKARRGELDVPLLWSFDEATARVYVQAFAEELAVAPVDAKLDLAGHRKIPDVPGQQLDLDATIAELRERGHQDRELNLVTSTVSAQVTLNDLADIDVTKMLSSFETRFSPYKKGRSANVARAGGLLDGLVIGPGKVVSFNDRVGPRTLDRGFHYAPEIVGDELTIGVGGGTCQVSSTLHGAAVYGAMIIPQRKSHSRPSGYTKLGLDATVSYPRVDLKIGNPYRFSVVVHVAIAKPGLIRVELLGGEAIRDVEYRYSIAHIEPYVRRITVKRHLKDGRTVRRQKGTRGMDVFSFVTLHHLDGKVEKRQYFSGYRPTPEVFWVAPDYERSELPDLPKWAKGVEGELARDGSDVYSTM